MLTRTRPRVAQPTYTPASAPTPVATDPADIAAETAQHLNTLTTHIPTPAPAAVSPIAAVLAGALHLLETRGWAATGRTCRDPNGALCLLGALRVAAGSTPNSTHSLPATRAAAHLLDIIQTTYPTAQTIPSWNDSQPTAHQPLAMLRLATHQARILGI